MFHDDVVGFFGNHGGMFASLWVDPMVEVSHHLWNKRTCTNGVLTPHCPPSVMGVVPTLVLGKFGQEWMYWKQWQMITEILLAAENSLKS